MKAAVVLLHPSLFCKNFSFCTLKPLTAPPAGQMVKQPTWWRSNSCFNIFGSGGTEPGEGQKPQLQVQVSASVAETSFKTRFQKVLEPETERSYWCL
ncbi:hypothetical protein ILYODFUR_032671 [Ilyodon furcidens]|uniref:Uncharacterized protein n=1 Tax=Ilyodon furcidens TaxID=33524 RepID=A0ABV0TNR1_9TELE